MTCLRQGAQPPRMIHHTHKTGMPVDHHTVEHVKRQESTLHAFLCACNCASMAACIHHCMPLWRDVTATQLYARKHVNLLTTWHTLLLLDVIKDIHSCPDYDAARAASYACRSDQAFNDLCIGERSHQLNYENRARWMDYV